MYSSEVSKVSRSYYPLGYLVSLFGTVLILLWIGIFKFTPTEAEAIKPLIQHHPLSSWLYNILSVQAVSTIVGIIEIIVAILILLTLKFPALRLYAGIGTCIIFAMTISYLFTTPNMLKVVDGIPIANSFILKDFVFLGFGISLLPTKKK